MYKKIKQYFRLKTLQAKLRKENKKIDFTVKKDHRKSSLIIDDKLPEFDKDSGSRRLHSIITILLKNNVNVFLLADFKEYKFKTDYVNHYKNLGVIVYEPALNAAGELITKNDFIATIIDAMDLVWLHRPLIFNKYYDFIRKNNQKVKIIFDMVDFHYIRMKREADLKNDKKLLIEANKFLEIETNNCKRADEIIVISETDKQSMLPYFKEVAKMKVISNIHDFIQNNSGFSSFEKRKDLLFVGSFEHQPNVDAVYFLKNDIMPLVWKKHPEIKVMVIGSNPTPEIENLTTESFQVLGYVEDLATYFNTTKLFVAPLRYGAGIKGKIGQSLEYGLPLVTTDIGAEGFDFGAFSNECIALNPEDFAAKIILSYSDEKLWNAISKNSEAVLKPFSLAITEKSILSLFD